MGAFFCGVLGELGAILVMDAEVGVPKTACRPARKVVWPTWRFLASGFITLSVTVAWEEEGDNALKQGDRFATATTRFRLSAGVPVGSLLYRSSRRGRASSPEGRDVPARYR